MGEDDSGFGLLGHVAAPYQLGLPRGLPAPAHCGERRSHASHGRIVTEVRVRGEGAARERGHFSLLHDSKFLHQNRKAEKIELFRCRFLMHKTT